jgi:hypothetical protein
MILRMAMAFTAVILLAPREPDVGMGQPQIFAKLAPVSEFRVVALDRLMEVRAEIKATRHGAPIKLFGLAW